MEKTIITEEEEKVIINVMDKGEGGFISLGGKMFFMTKPLTDEDIKKALTKFSKNIQENGK